MTMLPKNIFGLTGGIGSGKTTLANILKNKHSEVKIFDCDVVANEIMDDEKVKKEIKLILRNEVVVEGKLNRKKIAEIIFNNPIKKKKIESLIHPKVWQKLDKEIEKSNEDEIILVESAILFDIGKDKDIPRIITTICNVEERIKRLKKRNCWSDEEIKQRIKNQTSEEILKEKSQVIIDTNCSLEELEEKSEKLYQVLTNWENKKLTW